MAAALGAQPFTGHGREAPLPDADGLVADLVTAMQQELCNVTKAELVAQAPEDGELNDIAGELEIVKGVAVGPINSSESNRPPLHHESRGHGPPRLSPPHRHRLRHR